MMRLPIVISTIKLPVDDAISFCHFVFKRRKQLKGRALAAHTAPDVVVAAQAAPLVCDEVEWQRLPRVKIDLKAPRGARGSRCLLGVLGALVALLDIGVSKLRRSSILKLRRGHLTEHLTSEFDGQPPRLDATAEQSFHVSTPLMGRSRRVGEGRRRRQRVVRRSAGHRGARLYACRRQWLGRRGCHPRELGGRRAVVHCSPRTRGRSCGLPVVEGVHVDRWSRPAPAPACGHHARHRAERIRRRRGR